MITDSVRCRVCGAHNLERISPFCAHCGAPLADAHPPAEPAPHLHRAGIVALLAACTFLFFVVKDVQRKRELLVVLASWMVLVPVPLAGFLLAGSTLGARIEEIGFGIGGYLVRFRLRGRTVRLNWLPFGGYVKFHGVSEGEPVLEPPEIARLPGRPYQELSLPRRIVILLAGSAALMLLAFALLGPPHAWASFARGFPQFFQGTLHPRTTGTDLIRRLIELAAGSPMITVIGLIASKQAAWDLLPFPVTTGGQAILELFRHWRRMRRLHEIIQLIGLFALLACCATWFYAAYRAFSGG